MKDLVKQDFLVIDIETSGWGAGFKSEIVEIAIINHRSTTLLHSLVKPRRQIQVKAVALHGISDSTVRYAPPFSTLWPAIQAILANDVPIVAYNAEFDRNALANQLNETSELRREWGGVPGANWWHCAMEAYAQHYGEWSEYHKSFTNKKLTVACAEFGIEDCDNHNALGDARAALEVVRALASVSEDDNNTKTP